MSRNRTPSPGTAEQQYGFPGSQLYMANDQGFAFNQVFNPGNFGVHNIYDRRPTMPVQPPPTYPLYFPTSHGPPEERSQSSLSGATAETIASTPSSDVAANSKLGGKSANKWSDDQTLVLVQERVDERESMRVDDLESSKSSDTWKKIVEAVNKAGQQKTLKQCKDKLRNLKQSYKDAKTNNNKTGRGKKTSPYFEMFDEILGSRPVVTMPGVIRSNSGASSGSPSNKSTTSSRDSDDESDEDNDDTTNDEAKKRKSSSKSSSTKKKARKGKASIQDSFSNLTEKMLEIQNTQMEAMERSQTRAEELMMKFEIEQRKLDEDSRRRDQEFFLRMTQLLKK